MRSLEQMTFPSVGVSLIRSFINTLNGYHKTSMHLHKRPVKSVYDIAASQSKVVSELLRTAGDDPEVRRWAKKHQELVEQYGLSPEREKGK